MFTCMCDPYVDRSTCICVIENPARHRRKKILCSTSQGAKLNQHSVAMHAKCSSQSPTYSHLSHMQAPMQSFAVPAHATCNACCPTCALACICNLACSSLQRIGMFLHASIVISYEWVELCSNACALWHYLLRSCPDNGEHHMVMQCCARALMLAGGGVHEAASSHEMLLERVLVLTFLLLLQFCTLHVFADPAAQCQVPSHSRCN